jgi:tetratricopeptide (TPR) repeat protein
MTKSRAVDVRRLQSDVEWALAKGLGPRDLVPMLERLRRHAPRGSEPACFAGTELAELVLHDSPWRSDVLAREVLQYVETDRAWAVLGLSLALLGHYRTAKNAFDKALHLAPGCASYAHNLGHLLDAGLGRPHDALKWLERAIRAQPQDTEIAASYAHALLRAGRAEQARTVLEKSLPDASRVTALLDRWTAAMSNDASG